MAHLIWQIRLSGGQGQLRETVLPVFAGVGAGGGTTRRFVARAVALAVGAGGVGVAAGLLAVGGAAGSGVAGRSGSAAGGVASLMATFAAVESVALAIGEVDPVPWVRTI